ncbi:hypothetical protein E2C01_099235 [Portunus trituberculatus]|uniref:Uncharacterized protein n=1 Tax=Portunus trituberculatus TaxID=210409 RepID=A0A5B7KAB1_PORTR|nr:hypothetical protein [Portunus trituberculatus]
MVSYTDLESACWQPPPGTATLFYTKATQAHHGTDQHYSTIPPTRSALQHHTTHHYQPHNNTDYNIST